MNKLRLIIAREYMSIVGRKSFIFMTIGLPLLFILVAAVPAILAYFNDKGSDTQQIAVIDETGRYAAALHSDDMYNFVAVRGDTVTNAREFYDKAGGGLDAIVIIPRNVDSTGVVNIFSEGTITPALASTVRSALTDTIENAHLAEMGIPNLQEKIDKAHVDVDVRSIKWSEQGEQESSTDAAMGLGLLLSFITYMFVLMYGAMIMTSVIEEKTNRIVEVVVSSCRPFQLMLGKIIGVGLVGLTQMAIWIALLAIVGTIAGSVLGISSMPTDAISAEQMASGERCSLSRESSSTCRSKACMPPQASASPSVNCTSTSPSPKAKVWLEACTSGRMPRGRALLSSTRRVVPLIKRDAQAPSLFSVAVFCHRSATHRSTVAYCSPSVLLSIMQLMASRAALTL